MLSHEIILGTGEVETSLAWVPERISKFMGEIAVIDEGTIMVPPQPIVRHDGTTLFSCSGVQIIYPQLFDGAPVPEYPQLISQPVIRTQHLPGVEEGRSTSFVNYNLIDFGLNQEQHANRTKQFFERMKEVDTSGINDFRHVLIRDAPQNWNGLPVMMNTNEKLWINGVELGESIFYARMLLPSGEVVSVSELAFGFERLVYATDPGSSYYCGMLGGIDTHPVLKPKAQAVVCDAAKSTVLMAMNGVVPSNNDHGYQMRKFLKKAVMSYGQAEIDFGEVVDSSYEYWKSYIKPLVPVEKVKDVVGFEFDRNRNRRVLDLLASDHGLTVDININQNRSDFRKQLLGTGRAQAPLIEQLFDL